MLTRTGINLVSQAEKTLGCRYILGADVPMDDPSYLGAFDCAEKMTFDTRWVTEKLYGCVDNADWQNPEPFTGGWWQDVISGRVNRIEAAVAIITPGAMLLRKGSGPGYGHIGMVSDRKGETIEAMDSRHGVCRGQSAGRRWTCGILLPGIKYDRTGKVEPIPTLPVIYRLTKPYMHGVVVAKIQEVLGLKTDGIYGPLTRNAVARYQEIHGLVVDGEIGPQSLAAMGI